MEAAIEADPQADLAEEKTEDAPSSEAIVGGEEKVEYIKEEPAQQPENSESPVETSVESEPQVESSPAVEVPSDEPAPISKNSADATEEEPVPVTQRFVHHF